MSKLCPVAKKCGGCQLSNMNYQEQLSWKMSREISLLKRFGRVEEIIGMDDPFHYRAKVQAAFGVTRGGEVISGIYQSNCHRIVKVDSCAIEDRIADNIILTVRRLVKSMKIPVFDENSMTGCVRHVLVRRSFTTGQVLVVIVTGDRSFPSKKNLVNTLIEKHPEITTVVRNINGGRTSMVLGDFNEPLYGDGYITDELCGCRFRISAASFYQVNPVQTEILYDKAMEFAALKDTDIVFDAYCGVGTIGLIAAKRAGKVIGVELSADAVRDAKVNARLNGIENAEFYNADAGKFLTEAAGKIRPDVLFLDPPRAGSDKKFLSAAVAAAPERIIYVSCAPDTLARDLGFLTANGYKVRKIQPVDMFPHTAHVETVVRLSRSDMDS